MIINNQQPEKSAPYMDILHSCIENLRKEGYTELFLPMENYIQCEKTHKSYLPDEITIVNSYHFAGQSNFSGKAILYMVRTADGMSGTLTDLCHDLIVDAFVKEVERMKEERVKCHVG